MKATGVVRRIDSLGRIVVPKEIRKVLHIREGSQIEFYVDDQNRIILKKFSRVEDEHKNIKTKCSLIEELLTARVFFYADESIVQTGSDDTQDWIQERLATSFLKTAEVYRETGFKDVQIFADTAKTYEGTIVPVVIDSEYLGAFVILKNINEISAIELQQVQLVSKLLEKENMQ
jgi:looped-hinge helix DNA binding domain, AbrB family